MNTIVMTFGTFDHFHAGHEHYLVNAKKHGDEVITVIARDNTVKKIKGEFPDHTEQERKITLEETELADEVILGDLKDKYNVIRKHKPDVICLGYDQYAFTQQLQKLIISEGLNTKIVRLKPYHPNKFKSSLIRAKQTTLV